MNPYDQCRGATGGIAEQELFAGSCCVLREIDSLRAIASTLALGGDFNEAMALLFAQLAQAADLRGGLLAIVERERGELVVDEIALGAG